MSESWQPPAGFALPPQTLHLWRASLDQPEDVRQQWAALLSPEEQARAARFHFDHGRHHYQVGRGLLRWLLGGYLGLAPQDVAFAYGEQGKPFLPAQPHLSFNVSHGQGKILYGFCWEAAVGVDIEQIRLPRRADKLAHRFFAASETAVYESVPPDQKAEAFFNCWTRKEAYIKAIGEGLSCPLHAFEVTLRPGEPAQLLRIRGRADLAAAWALFSLTPFPGYRGAALVAGQGWQVACFDGDGVTL